MTYMTRRKAVIQGHNHVISAPYCKLQTLLAYETPAAYTEGTYGWNADIYEFGDVAICTGYRPFGDIRVPFETAAQYEQQARDTTPEQRRELVEQFISEMIKSAEAAK